MSANLQGLRDEKNIVTDVQFDFVCLRGDAAGSEFRPYVRSPQ
jgi:hypothetical protein